MPAAPDQSQPATNRHLDGRFELDIPTSGTYAITALWNDPWDESVSLPFREATARIHVDPKQRKVLSQQDLCLLEGGSGYGSGAIALFESDEKPTDSTVYPQVEAAVVQGRVTVLILHDGGKDCPEGLTVRLLRRPPFHRVAEAEVLKRTADGGITTIDVADPGGWYIAPPFVVAHDLGEVHSQGNGYDAVLRAVLNGSGGVMRVEIKEGGQAYSSRVQIAFYTNRYDFQEKPIPYDPATAPLAGSLDISFDHPVGNARGRRADYVVLLSSRFRKYLRKGDGARGRRADPLSRPADLPAPAARAGQPGEAGQARRRVHGAQLPMGRDDLGARGRRAGGSGPLLHRATMWVHLAPGPSGRGSVGTPRRGRGRG